MPQKVTSWTIDAKFQGFHFQYFHKISSITRHSLTELQRLSDRLVIFVGAQAKSANYLLIIGSNCSGVGSQDFVTNTLHPDKKGVCRALARDFDKANLYFLSVSLSFMTKLVASARY